jgi:anionic cell wall polymer biosynthesis LytR-Cps2A-Psr (LCP) family protein
MNYGYDPFRLEAGYHRLDGETALKFARTRHGDNDIRRGERQQQVIFAIMDAVADPANLPRVLSQASVLWAAVRDNFYTDLTFEQMISLGLYVKDLPRDQIRSATFDFTYLSNYTTNEGAAVLIPNQARVGELMAQVFGPNYGE